MPLKLFFPFFFIIVLVALETKVFTQESLGISAAFHRSELLHRKINLVSAGNRRTANPEGWEAYEGSIYNPQRGYGWLADKTVNGRDRGASATIVLADGTKTTPKDLGRTELANWQGAHQENLPLVFRIDLPDGWYRVTCTSVDPGILLPLVDRRSFKCRAHDVVFAGSNFGSPLVVSGNQLIEGTDIVEVTGGHLRIVVGDPAYSGWTWAYNGPWYKGWKRWLGHDHQYANGWYQKLTRTVDPGFHSLRLNSLEVERVKAPGKQPSLVYRDFFNRDDNPDINAGVADENRWVKVKLHPSAPDDIRAGLYKTSIKLHDPKSGDSVVGFLQQKLSPAKGIIRYTTRVSLFTGHGSQKHSRYQEAGIVLLAEPSGPTEFNSTFVGIALDSSREQTIGRLIYRVGNGREGYRSNLELRGNTLLAEIAEGEFEIVVEHDVAANILGHIRVNGVDITNQWSHKDRIQRISRGLFGIRSAFYNHTPTLGLQQFYWNYSVENM